MTTMKNTLICTVGTSLLESNLKRLFESPTTFPNLPNNAEALRAAYQSQDAKKIAAELAKIKATERVCGAEINTVEEIRNKKWLSLENLFFLVSDTPAGKLTGEILQTYFRNKTDLQLHTVEYCIVEELQDERPKDFKTHGLRNLVRHIGKYLERFGSEQVVIDATGGYKAQIALAVVIGQALEIPVYYKHERFSEIIDFPPLPISLDYGVLAENFDILTDFERGEAFSSEDLEKVDERLRVLLTEVVIDHQTLYELNPIGQIYLTGFRLRYQRQVKLEEASDRKNPTFGNDHHYPSGFKAFVTKIWSDNPWITTIHSVDYSQQKSIKSVGFKVVQEGEKQQLIGTYHEDFGARFQVRLPDESSPVLALAADRLNQKYRS